MPDSLAIFLTYDFSEQFVLILLKIQKDNPLPSFRRLQTAEMTWRMIWNNGRGHLPKVVECPRIGYPSFSGNGAVR
jgi:hypothetical protein